MARTTKKTAEVKTGLLTFAVELDFRQGKGYIAHPYWPEVAEVVDIQKKSGMNMARSEDKRTERLQKYLETQKLTMEHYRQLVKKAARPWYRVDPDDPKTEIIIPEMTLASALVHATVKAPAGARKDPEQLRCLLTLSDFRTGKKKEDGIYCRPCQPKDAKTGKPLSNQRAMRKNPYIQDFVAKGTVTFDEIDLKPEQVKLLLSFCGKYVGVGASRKMGFGRFIVTRFEQIEMSARDAA